MTNDTSASLSAELLEVQRTLGWMDLVLGNITDAVYVTDKNGMVLFVNQHLSNLLDIPRVFLLGRNINDVFSYTPTENPQKEFLLDNDLLEFGSFSSNIYEWCKGDRRYIFKISKRLLPTTSQTVFIAKDITAEHETSLMKSNFINIASHQLRTPMTSIMTYAHMLNDGMGGELDDSSRGLVNTIIRSSERMNRLINDILFITRIQNGETNLIIDDGTLGEVLVTLDTELQPKILTKAINFSQTIDADLRQLPCNTFVLHEILSNLLVNAIQYTPDEGQVSLQITNTDGQLCIRVKDTGIGIPAKDRPNIYNQFSRSSNAMQVFNEGTGLGLYIVKLLVDHIDGTISCESEENQGTTFTVLYAIN